MSDPAKLKLYTATAIAAELNVSATYICAVKKAMGIKGRWMNLAATAAWIAEHPDFRVAHVWPRRASKPLSESDKG